MDPHGGVLPLEATRAREPEGTRFAREFCGACWPEVEADLRARGKSVDWAQAPSLPCEELAQVFGEELFPLQDAERTEHLEGNLLRWRGVVDEEWLRTALGWTSPVDEEQIARIEELAVRFDLEIRAA